MQIVTQYGEGSDPKHQYTHFKDRAHQRRKEDRRKEDIPVASDNRSGIDRRMHLERRQFVRHPFGIIKVAPVMK